MSRNQVPDSEFLLYQPPSVLYGQVTWSWPFVAGIGPSGSNALRGPSDGTTLSANTRLRTPYGTSGSSFISVTPGQVWQIAAWFDLTSATSGTASIGVFFYQTAASLATLTVADFVSSVYSTGVSAGNAARDSIGVSVPAGAAGMGLQFGSSSTAVVCPNNEYMFWCQPYAANEPTLSSYVPSAGQTNGGWTAAALTAFSLATATL